MKLSKKTTTLVAFLTGACLFVTTAFADMMLGSGYDRLKNAMKSTAAQLESGLGNYTLESLYSLEIDGQTIAHNSETVKVDTNQQAKESISVDQNIDGNIRTNYRYNDRSHSIWKYSDDPIYYVMEHDEDDWYRKNWTTFDNPFNRENAAEFEKIVDALVGNLKDYVQAEERMEGGVAYSGSLSATQVPALVNAVSSFLVKQGFMDLHHYRNGKDIVPKIEKDIHIKSVTGSALENANGLLESLNGEIVLSGKDKNDVSHQIVLRLAFKLTSIGTTVVSMPDLSNAKVEKMTGSSGFDIVGKHVGIYKNDIVVDKDGAFVKIGERILEITSVEEALVKGKFRETIEAGYEELYPNVYEFEFELEQNRRAHWNFFEYTNHDGEKRYGQLYPGPNGRMSLDLEIDEVGDNHYSSSPLDYWNYDFNRVFEP